jgi:hypothetical protein
VLRLDRIYNLGGAGVDEQSTAASIFAGGFSIKAVFWYLVSKISALWCGFVFALALVMTLTTPKNEKELFSAIVSTGLFSVTGGAAFIDYFDLHTKLGTSATLGVACMLGLPGWFLVKIAFNFFNKNKDKSADDVINDIRKKDL